MSKGSVTLCYVSALCVTLVWLSACFSFFFEKINSLTSTTGLHVEEGRGGSREEVNKAHATPRVILFIYLSLEYCVKLTQCFFIFFFMKGMRHVVNWQVGILIAERQVWFSSLCREYFVGVYFYSQGTRQSLAGRHMHAACSVVINPHGNSICDRKLESTRPTTLTPTASHL